MGATRTILIIEDHDGVRGVFADALTEAGFAVLPVADAAEAFSHLPTPVDLVLLDLVMPVASMDGFAFLSNARTHAQLANTPVIVTSALGESVAAALDPGVATSLRIVSVLPKPIAIPTLVSEVRAVLDASP